MGGDLLCWSDFLKSGQIITGSTSLLYRGNDGTGRILNPDNYQPKGSYATTAELNELKTSVSSGKAQVASAITDKGVSTSSTASFSQMATNIRSIASGITPQLISGNVIYSNKDGNRYYWNNQYTNVNKYIPPVYNIKTGIYMFGHIILNNYTYIWGSSNTTTNGWTYTCIDIITGTIITFAPSDSYTLKATIPTSIKNGNPQLMIITNWNSTSALNGLTVLCMVN